MREIGRLGAGADVADDAMFWELNAGAEPFGFPLAAPAPASALQLAASALSSSSS